MPRGTTCPDWLSRPEAPALSARFRPKVWVRARRAKRAGLNRCCSRCRSGRCHGLLGAVQALRAARQVLPRREVLGESGAEERDGALRWSRALPGGGRPWAAWWRPGAGPGAGLGSSRWDGLRAVPFPWGLTRRAAVPHGHGPAGSRAARSVRPVGCNGVGCGQHSAQLPTLKRLVAFRRDEESCFGGVGLVVPSKQPHN